MLKEKSTSFTKNPDGSYTRTLKTIFKDDDTYNVIRVDQEIDEAVYDIVDTPDDYDFKVEYYNFEGNSKHFLLKRRS